MSGKPLQLCKLKRGKALAAFPTFVDTFNWLVDFCNNLKGDAEVDSSKSCRVDRSIEDSPVIKVDGSSGGIESVTDTEGTVFEKVKTITLASAEDSNVKVIGSLEDGNLTLTVGVYYV